MSHLKQTIVASLKDITIVSALNSNIVLGEAIKSSAGCGLELPPRSAPGEAQKYYIMVIDHHNNIGFEDVADEEIDGGFIVVKP